MLLNMNHWEHENEQDKAIVMQMHYLILNLHH